MAKKLDLKNLGNKVNQIVLDTGKVVGETAKKSFEITQNVSQKSAIIVQKGALDISDKMKDAGYQSRLKNIIHYSQRYIIANRSTFQTFL